MNDTVKVVITARSAVEFRKTVVMKKADYDL